MGKEEEEPQHSATARTTTGQTANHQPIIQAPTSSTSSTVSLPLATVSETASSAAATSNGNNEPIVISQASTQSSQASQAAQRTQRMLGPDISAILAELAEKNASQSFTPDITPNIVAEATNANNVNQQSFDQLFSSIDGTSEYDLPTLVAGLAFADNLARSFTNLERFEVDDELVDDNETVFSRSEEVEPTPTTDDLRNIQNQTSESPVAIDRYLARRLNALFQDGNQIHRLSFAEMMHPKQVGPNAPMTPCARPMTNAASAASSAASSAATSNSKPMAASAASTTISATASATTLPAASRTQLLASSTAPPLHSTAVAAHPATTAAFASSLNEATTANIIGPTISSTIEQFEQIHPTDRSGHQIVATTTTTTTTTTTVIITTTPSTEESCNCIVA